MYCPREGKICLLNEGCGGIGFMLYWTIAARDLLSKKHWLRRKKKNNIKLEIVKDLNSL